MKIIYNSKLAKLLLPPGYKAILIMFILLCKNDASSYDEGDIRHEATHAYQWASLTAIGGCLCIILAAIFTNLWLLLFAPFTFYIWYVLEWLTRFICDCFEYRPSFKEGFKNWLKQINSIGHGAYRDVVFEKEARAREEILDIPITPLSFLLYY